MAKKANETQEKFLSLGIFGEGENAPSKLRHLPKEQKIGRVIILQSHTLQRSLFDSPQKGVKDNEGNILYTKTPPLISEYDFRAYFLAAKSVLYDQSYICNNDDILSGFSREVSNLTTADGFRDEKGEPYYNGHIRVTLNELCRRGYGIPEGQVPTSKQRNCMRRAIDVVHNHPIGIAYANGKGKESWLIVKLDKDTDENGAETYHLILNPIFTTLGKGYGRLLRGTTQKLTKYLASKGKTGKGGKRAAHYAFMELLAIQNREKGEWCISIDSLLQHLNLIDMFSKNKKRAIENLGEIFEAFVGIGLLLEKPNPTIPPDGIYHFKLNPDPKW